MTYASGQVISAADYNSLVGNVALGVGSNINSVWGVGNGAAGYGQTPISLVDNTLTVTATQWSTLINNLNSILTHQSGSGSGISAPTAGTVITYLSTLQTAVNTAYTNRANYASSGSTVFLGSKSLFVNITAVQSFSGPAGGHDIESIVTFPSANQARLFFNCGGRIQFVTSSTNIFATGRSNAACADWNALGVTVSNTTNNITAVGYRGLSTVISSVSTTASGAPYASTSATQGIVSSSVTDTTNGANGSTVVHRAWPVIPADDAFGGAVIVTLTTTAYVIYPESTNLTAVWGTPVLT
jgi:hypothetical protein